MFGSDNESTGRAISFMQEEIKELSRRLEEEKRFVDSINERLSLLLELKLGYYFDFVPFQESHLEIRKKERK